MERVRFSFHDLPWFVWHGIYRVWSLDFSGGASSIPEACARERSLPGRSVAHRREGKRETGAGVQTGREIGQAVFCRVSKGSARSRNPHALKGVFESTKTNRACSGKQVPELSLFRARGRWRRYIVRQMSHQLLTDPNLLNEHAFP